MAFNVKPLFVIRSFRLFCSFLWLLCHSCLGAPFSCFSALSAEQGISEVVLTVAK